MLIVKELDAWYKGSFRAFELWPTSQVSLIQLGALVNQYNLADYRIEDRQRSYIHHTYTRLDYGESCCSHVLHGFIQ